jgi:hypothetical protein
VLDKTKSHKFVGGKLVERTLEEQARIDQLKAAQAEQAKQVSKRLPRTNMLFARLTANHMEKLFDLEHVCWPLFSVLLLERLRHGGRPFPLPARYFGDCKGLSQANLYRLLNQLETAELISIERQGAPKPPLITVHG